MERRARERFDDFYRLMYGQLVLGLPRILGDVYDTEDIAQDALQDAWRTWERISVFESPQTWTWRVALNIHSNRKQRRRREQEHRALFHATAGDMAPEATVDHQLWDRVAALPYAQRTTIVLRHVGDLSFGQIAEIMGCSAAAARQNHRKGKRQLAVLLSDKVRDG